MKKNFIYALVLTLGFVWLTGCGQNKVEETGIIIREKESIPIEEQQLEQVVEVPVAEVAGGVLYLKVNPEIAISYDESGNVVGVEGRNADGSAILENYSDYTGKTARQVVAELVAAIGEAGYFIEEVEGEARRITIEIERGSYMPNAAFLDEIVADVQSYVNAKPWHDSVDIYDMTDYGVIDYKDTNYSPNNNGITDYGMTDYNDTDYGPNNDGITDYGMTDYNDTDYGPNNDGITDYGMTDYNDSDYGATDYHDGTSNDTDYGKSDYDD